MLEKAATIKRFEYLPLSSELKKQTCIPEKKYQRLDKASEFDKKGDKTINKDGKKSTLQKYNKSDLICDSKHSFYKYHYINKCNNCSFESKYKDLISFYQDLNELSKGKSTNEHTKEEKKNMYNNASELYNVLLRMYFGEYMNLSYSKQLRFDPDYCPKNLLLADYDYKDYSD